METDLMSLFKRVPKRLRRLVYVGAAIFAILVAILVLLLIQLNSYKAPAASAEEKVQKIVEEIGRTIILPQGELPTVGVVADPEKLRDQPFFANAEVGDQILIYQKSKKAVLWRPSVRKVVEVSSLDITLPSTSSEN